MPNRTGGPRSAWSAGRRGSPARAGPRQPPGHRRRRSARPGAGLIVSHGGQRRQVGGEPGRSRAVGRPPAGRPEAPARQIGGSAADRRRGEAAGRAAPVPGAGRYRPPGSRRTRTRETTGYDAESTRVLPRGARAAVAYGCLRRSSGAARPRATVRPGRPSISKLGGSRRWTRGGRGRRSRHAGDADGGRAQLVRGGQVDLGADAPVVVAGRVVEDLPDHPAARLAPR